MEQLDPSTYLNAPEEKLLGALVRRLCATSNPRFQRALEKTGAEATVRMACVNALRIYAIVLFMLATLSRIAAVSPLAYLLYGLSAASMAWSFWCLYTVVGPEREFKSLHASQR
jgi:hypothetical protein